MLNTNNTAAQSTKVSNVLLYPAVEKVTEPEVGYVFTTRDFAKDWDSVCFRPTDRNLGEVRVGMRRLTTPTLVITSHSNSMAFILATEKTPVYIPGEFDFTKEGYIIAARLAPIITPDYIFYMCQYELWRRMLHWYTEENGGFSWKTVGICDYDEVNNIEIVLTPLDYIRNVCELSLPTISEQKAIVANAKEQEAEIAGLTSRQFNVVELINKYKAHTSAKNIFNDYAYGLLLELYTRAKRSRVDSKVVDALSNFHFERNILNDEELNFLANHLSEVFDLLVNPSRFAHNKEADFLQPQEVTKFLCEIANFPKDVVVYNPFAGAASYAVNLPNHVVGEELNLTTWALAQIRLAANNVNVGTEISLGNSFDSMADGQKYKAIITSPIYTVKEGQEIYDIVSNLYAKLEDGGTLVSLVTPGFLYSTNSGYCSIKERLIADRAIKGVITLPANIFPGTNISQSVLVITKGEPNEQILFADASKFTRFSKSAFRATTFDYEQFLKSLDDDLTTYFENGGQINAETVGVALPYDKIAGVDLTPKRYLVRVPENGIALSEYATEVEELRGKERTAEYFITGSSIPESRHGKPFIPIKANSKVATAKRHVQLPDNAVIVAIANGTIRSVYTEKFNGRIAFPGWAIKVLEPKAGVSAKFLAALISTKIVADQFLSLATGTTQPRFGHISLDQIIVPLIEKPEDREALVTEVITSEMTENEREIAIRDAKREREIRSTRHAMIQTLASLSSNWSLINDYAEDNDGKIDLADSIGRINPMPMKKLFTSINHAIKTLEQQVDSLKLEVQDWGKETAIDPYAFIQQYIETHNSPLFKMENLGNDNIVDAPWFDDETGESGTEHIVGFDILYAPKRLLERIFNNIVANARAHGFTDLNRNDYKITFDWSSENSNIVITIANNGTPLKEGVTEDDVFMRGFTTSLNEDSGNNSVHSGQGGFEIKTLMEGYGKAEILSYPGNEFSVVYKLTFEKTNTETINLFED